MVNLLQTALVALIIGPAASSGALVQIADRIGMRNLAAEERLAPPLRASAARANLDPEPVHEQRALESSGETVTLSTATAGQPVLRLEPAWRGRVPSGEIGALDLGFRDATDNRAGNTEAMKVYQQFVGTGSEHGARIAGKFLFDLLGPSAADNPLASRTYVGIDSYAIGNAGDNGWFTAMSATCTPSSCSNGTVIPVVSTGGGNGAYSFGIRPGDQIAIVLDPGGPGLAPNDAFYTRVTAVDLIRKTITVRPGIAGRASRGNAVLDPGAAVMGINALASVGNNPVPSDPPKYFWAVVGEEADAGIESGSSAFFRAGLTLGSFGNERGKVWDFGLGFGAAGGPGKATWQVGIQFGPQNGGQPLGADSTMMLAVGSAVIRSFFELSSYKCSGGYELHFANFAVDCDGNLAGSGSVSVGGALVAEGAVAASPESGSTVAVGTKATLELIEGSATLSALTIKLPATPADRQIIPIWFDVAVKSLNLRAGGSSTSNLVACPHSISAGQRLEAIWISAEARWHCSRS